jgi:N-formylglutamate amidohydrolase
MGASHPLVLEGPAAPGQPLLLDSPHSGREFPADFDAAVTADELRDGEDCHVDALYRPAVERGVWLLSTRVPRTYLDPNRHAGDIDLELIEGGRWPAPTVPSGKARLGKALVWRTLDDGRPIYARKLRVDEVLRRIERCHAPYHAALAARIEGTRARFGVSYHVNCHSMNAVSGAQGEGGPGVARADFVLGDRDGTSCEPGFTELARRTLASLGYDVRVNDPYKGVELVKAYAEPARGRHSLQIEVNKRLYLDGAGREPGPNWSTLQAHVLQLVEALADYARHAAARVRG